MGRRLIDKRGACGLPHDYLHDDTSTPSSSKNRHLALTPEVKPNDAPAGLIRDGDTNGVDNKSFKTILLTTGTLSYGEVQCFKDNSRDSPFL